MSEQDYIRGSKSAYRSLLLLCIRELSPEIDDNIIIARLLAERDEAIGILRDVCKEHGDNKWEDNLYLPDIIEKHLSRYL